MNALRRTCTALRSERGQTMLLIVGLLTAFFALIAIVVDVGFLLGERRAAQKDVDAAALAGAQELALDLSVAPGGPEDMGWASNGQDIAFEWITRNAVELDTTLALCPTPDGLGDAGTDANVCADTSCFAGDGDIGLIDSIAVDLQAPSTTFFGRIFDVDWVGVGAHAKACVGSLTGTTGLRPWTISMYNSECFEWIDDGDGVKEFGDDMFLPWYGEDCVIRAESPSSQVGSIRLGDDPGDDCNEPGGGTSKYRENIVEGSEAWCEVGGMVDTEPGLAGNPTATALGELLAGEGECDALFGDGDGIDQFGESFSPPDIAPTHDEVYGANDCTTPRAVDIVIVDEFDGTGFDSVPIRGFASYFLLQCEVLDHDDEIVRVDQKCDLSGSESANFQIRGRFMQVLKLEGLGGALDPFGTRMIWLVE